MYYPLNDLSKLVCICVVEHLKRNLDYSLTSQSVIDTLTGDLNETLADVPPTSTRDIVNQFVKVWDKTKPKMEIGDVTLRTVKFVPSEETKPLCENIDIARFRTLIGSTLLNIREVVSPPIWNVVVIDVETGGLTSYDYKLGKRGSEHYPLFEVAVQVVDKNLQPKAEPFVVVIHQPESEIEKLSDYVMKMHTDSGLLEKVRASKISQEEAEKMLINYLEKNGVPKHSQKQNKYTILAGNSHYTDLEWINTKMNYFSRYFSHQLLDFSAFQLLNKMTDYPVHCPVKEYNHTAEADLKETLAEGRCFHSLFLDVMNKGGYHQGEG